MLEKTLESLIDSKKIKPTNPKGKKKNADYSLKGMMLKLKFQYFDHLIRRADSLEKTLMLGKIEGRRRGDSRGDREGGDSGWMASSTQWI